MASVYGLIAEFDDELLAVGGEFGSEEFLDGDVHRVSSAILFVKKDLGAGWATPTFPM